MVRSVGWQAYKRVTRRPIVVSLPGGARLRCHPDSNSASNVIYFGALFDPVEMSFMLRYLRSGDGFIDGGANIGVYSLLAASIVGPDGHVVAFEPDPVARGRILENAALNGFESIIDASAVALWDAEGIAAFRVGKDVSNRVELRAEDGGSEVPTGRLDDLLPARPWAYGKLDVEGAELHALRGAERLLAAADPPVWQIEVIDHLLERAGSSGAEVWTCLLDHGFEAVSWDAATGSLRTIDDPRSVRRNALVVAKNRRDEVDARL